MISPPLRRHALAAALLGLSLSAGCGRSPEELLQEGIEAGRDGKYLKARDSLALALRDRGGDPASAEAFNLLGIAAWRCNDAPAAEAAFRKAMALNPGFFEPVYNLGVIKCEQDAFNEGLLLLKQAAEMNPQDTQALEYLSAEHRRRGNWSEAHTAMLNAHNRAPEVPRVLTALALTGLRTEGSIYAASFLKKAVRLDPEYAPALFSLGRVYADWVKEPSGALQHYRAFLARPGGEPAYRKHAESEVARLERELAASPAAAAAPVKPEAGPAPSNPLAPRPAPAPGAAAAAPAGAPDNPVNALIEKARREAQAGNSTAAYSLCIEAAAKASSLNSDELELKAYKAATALCPDQAQSHFMLGRYYTEKGRHREAMESYRQASVLDPNWSKSLRAAAVAAIECGEYQFALDSLSKAVKVDPDNADALWALALFYETQLRLDESARQTYERFITSFPSHARAADARRRVEYLSSKPELKPSLKPSPFRATPGPAAVPAPTPAPPPAAGAPAAPTARNEVLSVTPVALTTVSASRTLTPKTPLAATPIPPTAPPAAASEQERLFRKATDHQQRGELDQAVETYNKLLAANPAQASVHYNLGLIYLKKNQPDSARKSFEQALAAEPSMHAAHYQLGAVLLSLNRAADALRHFQAVIDANPDHALAQLGIGRAYMTMDPARARTHLARFVDLSPNDPEAPLVRRWLIQQ